MSSLNFVSVQVVDVVVPHPYADKLDIAHIGGFPVVVSKDSFKAGDRCVYFPADTLIPEHQADTLGVSKYLKSAIYPGDVARSQCRVGACKLRGVASYGFAIPTSSPNVGENLDVCYQAVRYDPPPVLRTGSFHDEKPGFFQYYDMDNVHRVPDIIQEGEMVMYTEKLHGTNSRMAVIGGEIIAGTHRRQVENTDESIYWKPWQYCQKLLLDMQEDGVDIIIFGEIIGPGIQDLHYGLKHVDYRCFDIMVGGQYLDALLWLNLCKAYAIPTVPVLAVEKFSRARLAELTDGQSTLADHIREGVVVKTTTEHLPRAMFKSVSVDYLNRD